MLSRIVVLNLFLATIVYCQVPDSIQRYRNDNHGNYANRRMGTMVGNRINTIFFNYGEIGYWEDFPTVEWPAGSGHNYLDGYTFMVAAEVTAPGDTQIIHPLETAYREQYSADPVTGTPWGFEPIAGYSNPSSTSPAISTDKTSWPAQWPVALGLDSTWNGHWYGYFGKDTTKANFETFFIMDDSQDKKFTIPPFDFYPIVSDSTRDGLGLREEVRGFQWNDSLRKGAIFLKYNTWNISHNDYDKVVFGIFCDPGVGCACSGEPAKSAAADSSEGLVYVWAPSGEGFPGNWATGYFGIGILSAPLSADSSPHLSLTIGTLADKSSNGLWPKSNEVMWNALTDGAIDTAIANTNVTFVLGAGPFAFAKWSKEEFTTAIILGNDLGDLLNKKENVQAIYDNNFVIPDSLLTSVAQGRNNLPVDFGLSQNYPNPFNPSTTIRYNLPINGFVALKVFDVLGRQVATLISERQTAGPYSVAFNGSRLASGVYFYRLIAPGVNIVKRMVLAK